ncbi:ATPase, T2SS/T4P/T4SS family [Erysipelothrix anatis]|uniref:ATPase, T2SS/T4P/T4SS family n=1 Tax=Erysipelothrix anatis TaxID=2683713 RepID=UPI00140A087D|nr:ATPase, T2SS/T4P/T4SS family [Erysipelothrix anatis]
MKKTEKIDTKSKEYLNNYSLIEDAIKQHYPKEAVDALMDQSKRDHLQKTLQDDFKTIKQEVMNHIIEDIVGLGKFQEFLLDENVTDIGFNGTDLWIETTEKKFKVDDPEIDEAYVHRIVQRFANYAHVDWTEKNPRLNTQLGNIRISATDKSISPGGITMSMRHARAKLKISKDNFSSMADMAVYELLEAFVKSGSNFIVDGIVGSGKTELMKMMIGWIPDQEKIIMIEDTLETHIKTIYPLKDVYNWQLLDSLEPFDLIMHAKRNNPTHVILTEALDHAMYQIHQSVKAGFKIMVSLHAFDAKSVPNVMIDFMRLKYDVPEERMRDEIYHHYDLGIHTDKRDLSDGSKVRWINEIVEYTPDGLKTLYKRVLDESSGEPVFVDSFEGKVSFQKMESMNERGIKCEWNILIDGGNHEENNDDTRS